MRTYELKLAGGDVVRVTAWDSWEATCVVAAKYRKRVLSFRLIDNERTGA